MWQARVCRKRTQKPTALPQDEGHRAAFSLHFDVTGTSVHFTITAAHEEGTTVPTPGWVGVGGTSTARDLSHPSRINRPLVPHEPEAPRQTVPLWILYHHPPVHNYLITSCALGVPASEQPLYPGLASRLTPAPASLPVAPVPTTV